MDGCDELGHMWTCDKADLRKGKSTNVFSEFLIRCKFGKLSISNDDKETNDGTYYERLIECDGMMAP